MLRRTNDLKGLPLGARDGEIGHVRDFYFDDQSWVVRYFVADTGTWLASRKVLISPHAVLHVLGSPENKVEVALTKKQIEDSPPIEHDIPVSRQFELQYYDYYNWPYYWQGPALWGPAPRPGTSYSQLGSVPLAQRVAEPTGDPHLRSASEVIGYYIHAADGDIGHVEDFIINDEDWVIQYLVVDTRNWWPGKKVLVPPSWASSLDWTHSKVHLDLDRATIKGAPEYDLFKPISREYEGKLFNYYNRPPYWEERRAA